MQSVASALAHAKALGIDPLDAQVGLAHCLGQRRTWLLAHGEARLTPAQAQDYGGLLERRAAGEPLAYLVGEKEFRGLTLNVDSRVLVPRPETEHLVDWGLEILAARSREAGEPSVLDLGTGSGAIALAVKSAWPTARVTAVDASSAALEVARTNAARLALDVEFVSSDWWQTLADRRFDLVLCNPPYVASAAPGLPALRHEPISALTTGGSGLEALMQVIQDAPRHLEPRGWLLLEHGADQAAAVREAMREHGLDDAQTRVDLAGLERCTGGRCPLG
jgi:release factor glutamine methyltransferase